MPLCVWSIASGRVDIKDVAYIILGDNGRGRLVEYSDQCDRAKKGLWSTNLHCVEIARQLFIQGKVKWVGYNDRPHGNVSIWLEDESFINTVSVKRRKQLFALRDHMLVVVGLSQEA